jgi:glucan 1,3-beta-glucosidase
MVHYEASLGSGLAKYEEPFWLEKMKHQGKAAFNPDADYQVFRNIKDFGAVGDGRADDTAAIKYICNTVHFK